MEVRILKTCYGLQRYLILDGVPVRVEQLSELTDWQTYQAGKSPALANMEHEPATTVGAAAE